MRREIVNRFPFAVLLAVALGGHSLCASAEQGAPPFIPMPTSFEMGQGALELKADGRIIASEEELMPLAKVFALELKAAAGLSLKVCEGWAQATPCTLPAAGDLVLALDPKAPEGGYLLDVTDRVEIRGHDYRGTAAGTVTILQAIETGEFTPVSLPRVTVRDEPRVDYCGITLNVAEREYPIEQLRECIPLCRFYKVRYLHLRLTDDAAWTFPSTKYPQLGTKNPGTPNGGPPAPRYRLEDLTNLVHYADTLGVTLVPEIQMPGHSRIITGMLPEFGPDIGMMNITRDAVFPVLSNILSEVAQVFASSPYIHIGGDEADFTKWVTLPEATNHVEKTGWDPPEILCRFFIRMNDMVKGLGKRTIMWEGFEPNDKCKVPADVIVMSRDNPACPAEALIRDGYSIINCPRRFSASWESWGLYTCNGAALPTNAAVIGASWVVGANPSISPLELIRHAGRLSDRTWNVSTNWTSADFKRRLARTDKVADRILYRFSWRLVGPHVSGATTFKGATRLEAGPYAKDEVLRYTIDGSEPTAQSPVCRSIIELEATTRMKARVFDSDGKPVGLTWTQTFILQ